MVELFLFDKHFTLELIVGLTAPHSPVRPTIALLIIIRFLQALRCGNLILLVNEAPVGAQYLVGGKIPPLSRALSLADG